MKLRVVRQGDLYRPEFLAKGFFGGESWWGFSMCADGGPPYYAFDSLEEAIAHAKNTGGEKQVVWEGDR